MTARAGEGGLASIATQNAATAVAARVSAIVAGMILTPFVLGRLEARLYGLVIAVGSVYEYLSLLRGGMGGALRRYVTFHHHAGRSDLARQYYAAGFWWAGILRSAVLLAGFALAWPLTGFFHLEPALRPVAAIGVALVFLAGVVSDQSVLLSIPVYATGRMAAMSLVQLALGWVRLAIFAAALTWIGATLAVYGGAMVAAEIVALFAFIVLARRAGTVGAVLPRPQVGSAEVRGELFRYGGLAVLSQTAALLYLSADNLLIGRIYGPEAVTHYSLGTRWVPLVLGFLAATLSGMTPLLTSLDAQGATGRSRQALQRLLALTSALAFPLCLTPCVVGDLFLTHWVGAEYRGSARYMIAMLGPAAIDGALSPVWLSLVARGRIGWVAAGDILVAVGNVALSLVLALSFGLGLLGFALGNTAAIVVKNLMLVLVARRRDPTMPSLAGMIRPLPLALLGTAPALLALGALRPWFADSLAGVIAAGLAGCAAGLGGSLLATTGPRGIAQLWRILPWARTEGTAGSDPAPAPPAGGGEASRPTPKDSAPSATPNAPASPPGLHGARASILSSSAAPRREPGEEGDLISVVIPVYNGEEYIDRALRSVEAQTLAPGEILVVDDQSTDRTPEMLADWERAGRIRVLHCARGGPGGARNAGLREARGTWVAFLDADDEFAPTALEDSIAAAGRHPGASWFITDVVRVRPGLEEHKASTPPAGGRSSWVPAILERNFVARGFFFRRETLLEFGGFDPVYNYFEDWELFIRLIRAGRLPAHIQIPLYRYIETPGSLTRDPEFMVRVLRRVLNRHHRPLARSGNRALRRIYARRLWGLGQDYYYKLRRPGKAIACVVESLAYDFNATRFYHRILPWKGAEDSDPRGGAIAADRLGAPDAGGAARAATRILFVEASPYPSYGGSKRVLVNLVRGLDRTRWRPHVVCCSDGPWVGELRAAGAEVVLAPASVSRRAGAARLEAGPAPTWRSVGVRRLSSGEYRLSLPRRLLRDLRSVARREGSDRRASRRLDRLVPEDIALIHYNGPMHADYSWYNFARRRGLPYVTHEHGIWKTPPLAWRRVAREAAGVFCLTEERIAVVRATAGVEVRAVWLPNGVAAEAFQPRTPREEVRRALGLPEGTALVITAGHLQRWKGQDLAVEAAGRLRDRGRAFVWVLAGREIEPGFAGELRESIARAGLEERVRLLGERDDLPDLFAAADVAAHTSVHPEPFGMVVVEAMAAGTPVVGPAEGAVPLLIRHGTDGRCYLPRDAASLAEAVDAFLADPAERERCGLAARERARAEFSLDRQARRANETYESIVRRSGIVRRGRA